jgi:nucleoside-diphosphate-sugar epimerase
VKPDVVLLGATGQIGRHILRLLVGRATVAVVMRRTSRKQAIDDLRAAVGNDAGWLDSVHVILGDSNSADLSDAPHIINASGLTTLSGPPEPYWEANVRATVRLAHHAATTGAHLHLLSTIAVADCRHDDLTERDAPRPHPDQGTYVLSKCLSELLAEAVLPPERLSVYRTADVVPPMDRVSRDIRRNHWITVLLGTDAAAYCPRLARFQFYAAPADQMASAVLTLLERDAGRRYHLFGHKYDWSELARGLDHADVPAARMALGRRVAALLDTDPPISARAVQQETLQILHTAGFGWRQPNTHYWQRLAAQSRALFVRAEDSARQSQ